MKLILNSHIESMLQHAMLLLSIQSSAITQPILTS